MFTKLIEKIVNNRMDAIEARINNLLAGAVDAAVEKALTNRMIVRHDELATALNPIKGELLTADKVKEIALAEVESVVEDAVASALEEMPDADQILTKDDLNPDDVLTKDGFDPDDYDIITKDTIGEFITEPDTDEITSQVVSNIKDALNNL